MPQPIVSYTKTNLVEITLDKPKKSIILKARVLGKVIRMLRDMQEKLYPNNGGGAWVSRYFYEVVHSNRPLEELDQYIKNRS
jgi:hypothetical protein